MNYSSGVIRLILLLVNFFYVIGLFFAYSTYLIWQDYVPFFNYYGMTPVKSLVIFFFLFFSVFLLPVNLCRASDIFVWVLFYFLYVPIFVFCMGSVDDVQYLDLLVVVVAFFSFLLISLPSFVMRGQAESNVRTYCFKGGKLASFLIVIWVALFFLLISKYSSVMSFRGLDEVYVQRILGKADSLFYGYAQVYFGYVISVGLVVLGLFYKKVQLILLGVLGCIILYSITAERTIFIIPIFLYSVYLLVSTKKPIYWLVLFVFFLGVYFFVIAFFGDYNKFFKDLGFYVLTRVVAIPGLFFVDYYNYFSEVGYTNFSHVKGLSLFFSANPNLAQDPLYPELGRIVARDVHGINSNSNASFLSWDGVAGFGLLGVLIVSALFSAILFLVNFLTKHWPLGIILPLMAPLALTLTNGSLFTVLLSFGLLFWMSVFLFSKISLRR